MNPKYHLLIAVAALSLNACSTDDTCPEPEIGGYKISFTVAEDTETRTTLEMLEAGNFLRWVSTDKVGIYTVGNNGKNVNSNIVTTSDVSKSPVEFVGTLEQPISSGDMFYAYYPYNAEQRSTDRQVVLSIPAEQQQTKAGVYNGESNPLVAVPMELSQDWGNAGHISSVRFRPLGAIVELQLYSSDEALRSESIHSVTFESETALAGDFQFDLTNVTTKGDLPISGYESKVATTSLEEPATIPATKDEAARVYLTIAPGQYIGQIVVKTNLAKYTFRLKNAMNFKRAVIKGLPADLAKAEQTAVSPDDPIHFEDSTVEKICLDNWDTNKNGELSYKEASTVTDLKGVFQYNKNVTSFNELRYFNGLQSIRVYAFSGCSSLTSVTIPETVTSIGSSAFDYCTSLTSITIPETVTSIGDSAFSNCSSLTRITIPEAVSSIGESVFSECSSLSAFYGKYASADNRCLIMDGALLAFAPAGLTEYRTPEGVTSIGNYAFDRCYSLTSINLPEGVTSIGSSAFGFCRSLTSINIPQTVSSISEEAFIGCSSLSAFEGEYASADNRCLIIDGALLAFAPAGLTEYRIPEGVTSIGNYAFYVCSSLTSIHLPEGVTSIGSSAFHGCYSLTSINLPDGVTSIGNSAFYSCSSLTSIHLPEGVTSIGNYAFYSCISLTSINIPDRVTTIEILTFAGCRNLTSVNIPERVTTIRESAFKECSGLTSITIPEKVTTIDYSTFSGCSKLTSITIPAGVTKINSSAFSNCSNLTSVYCKPTNPPTLGSSVFYNTSSTMQIHVPAASVEVYKAAENWSTYANQIVADNN